MHGAMCWGAQLDKATVPGHLPSCTGCAGSRSSSGPGSSSCWCWPQCVSVGCFSQHCFAGALRCGCQEIHLGANRCCQLDLQLHNHSVSVPRGGAAPVWHSMLCVGLVGKGHDACCSALPKPALHCCTSWLVVMHQQVLLCELVVHTHTCVRA